MCIYNYYEAEQTGATGEELMTTPQSSSSAVTVDRRLFAEGPKTQSDCSLPQSDQEYHWRQLPQVCLARQNKTFVATKLCLSRQNLSFAINKCLSQQNVCDKTCDKRRVLPRQTRVCRDKSKFVVIKLVATKVCLSRQAYFCRDKRRILS